MLYGYCRISRKTQSLDRQIRNIRELYPDAVIVSEAFTGTRIDRPEWNRLYRWLKEGDTVVFDSVSRMSRNAEEGSLLYKDLFEKGVSLIFLKERHIDTATYKKTAEGQIQLAADTGDVKSDELIEGLAGILNRYLLRLAEEQIRLAFEQSEKEVTDLHQRTKEGIETARLKGRQIGGVRGRKLTTRKSIAAKAEIREKAAEFGGAYTDKDLIKVIGISRNTYYKYKRELRAEAEPYQ